MKIGVVAVQGAVSEHIEALERAFEDMGKKGTAVPIRRKDDLERIDGLIIPGGESTTISKLLGKFELFDGIRKRVEEGMPLMGTCAGCVALAKEGDEEVRKTDTRLLELMDMTVKRNAFGRQKESFELDIEIEGFDKPYRAVFIRAPVIAKIWGRCEPLAGLDAGIIMAKQENMVAAAFHPELTADSRIHRMFLEMV